MNSVTRTITYGDEQVPLLIRDWKRRASMTPYHRIEKMEPGHNWRQMTEPCKYTEHYVQLADGPIPVGVMIARELCAQGAICAVCTDVTFGRLRLVDTDLICIEAVSPMSDLLESLRAANNGSLRGLPDAVGIFPHGKVVMREAKVAKKDYLSKTQHSFAPIARRLLGDDLDLAVIEWGYDVAEES